MRRSGFTIVELLIVIVVIGILAAITLVAFGDVQQRAKNTARYNELKAWQKLFTVYAVQEGHYPDITRDTNFCLGTGFPDRDGSGLGNCRDLGTAATRHQVNPALNAELSKVGTLPNGTRDLPASGTGLGPWMRYETGGAVRLTMVIAGLDCPEGTTGGWEYGTAGRMCSIVLPAR